MRSSNEHLITVNLWIFTGRFQVKRSRDTVKGEGGPKNWPKFKMDIFNYAHNFFSLNFSSSFSFFHVTVVFFVLLRFFFRSVSFSSFCFICSVKYNTS